MKIDSKKVSFVECDKIPPTKEETVFFKQEFDKLNITYDEILVGNGLVFLRKGSIVGTSDWDGASN